MHATSPRHRPTLVALILTALVALPLTGQQATEGPPRRHWDVADVVAVSPDGRWVASGSRDGMIEVLARTAGAAEWHKPGAGSTGYSDFFGQAFGVRALAFSPDSRLLASGGTDRVVRIWDAESGDLVRELAAHSGDVSALAFSPDGRLLASGGFDMRVITWEVASGRKVQDRTGHKSGILDLAFSPDGRMLASGGGYGDNTVRLWDAATGKTVRTLRTEEQARSLAYDPSGRFLVVSEVGRIGVWDPAIGSLLRTLATGLYFPEIALSADGRALAATNHAEIVLIEVESGRVLRTLTGHKDDVEDVAFGRDGNWLASTSADGSIRSWDADSGAPLSAWTPPPSWRVRVVDVQRTPEPPAGYLGSTDLPTGHEYCQVSVEVTNLLLTTQAIPTGPSADAGIHLGAPGQEIALGDVLWVGKELVAEVARMQAQSGQPGSIRLDLDNGLMAEGPVTPGGGDPASRIKVSIIPLRPATLTLVFTVPPDVGNEELRLFFRDAEPVPLAAPPAPAGARP